MNASLLGIVFFGGTGCREMNSSSLARTERGVRGALAQQRLRGWARLPRDGPHPHSRVSRASAARPPARLGTQGHGGRRAHLGLGCGDRPEAALGGETAGLRCHRLSAPAPAARPCASSLWGRLRHPVPENPRSSYVPEAL